MPPVGTPLVTWARDETTVQVRDHVYIDVDVHVVVDVDDDVLR